MTLSQEPEKIVDAAVEQTKPVEVITEVPPALEKIILTEVADPEAMKLYEERVTSVDTQVEEVSIRQAELQNSLHEVRDRLYQGNVPQTPADPSVLAQDEKLVQLQKEKVATSSNYPGDWTSLLQERITNPVNKERILEMKTAARGTMIPGRNRNGGNPEDFQSHYDYQLRHHDRIVNNVFAETKISFDPLTYDLNGNGHGAILNPGLVHMDAKDSLTGKLLSNRQKNIIEAHEKGHGLRDFTSPLEKADFIGLLDTDAIIAKHDLVASKVPTEKLVEYLLQPVEIAERMAQLKNYFGFRGNEVLTSEHLEYAREHYVADTGYDNSMIAFFNGVTEAKENDFLRVANKYVL